jgi:hypothetical protein
MQSELELLTQRLESVEQKIEMFTNVMNRDDRVHVKFRDYTIVVPIMFYPAIHIIISEYIFDQFKPVDWSRIYSSINSWAGGYIVSSASDKTVHIHNISDIKDGHIEYKMNHLYKNEF